MSLPQNEAVLRFSKEVVAARRLLDMELSDKGPLTDSITAALNSIGSTATGISARDLNKEQQNTMMRIFKDIMKIDPLRDPIESKKTLTE